MSDVYEKAVSRQAAQRALKDYLKLPFGKDKDAARKSYLAAAMKAGVQRPQMMGFRKEEED